MVKDHFGIDKSRNCYKDLWIS